MRRLVAIVALAVSGAVATGAFVVLSPGDPGAPASYLGYVEAESLLVGAESGGRLVELAVARGDVVAAGAPLFALDARTERARIVEAEARLAHAKAQLADLRASQQRPEQIDVLEASRRRAEADLAWSQSELRRQEALFARGVIAEARLDQARTAFERDRAALAEIAQEIETARLAARDAQIEAAAAEVAAAEAVLRQAQKTLDDRSVTVPCDGRVLDVFYRVGEVVAAGQPVVEILPPENLRVRFYLPQPALAGIALGQRVAVACDGCPPGLTAQISFISPEAEFTPPVIFSREERAKLVFLVEARPLDPHGVLKPGLPVEVIPIEEAPAGPAGER